MWRGRLVAAVGSSRQRSIMLWNANSGIAKVSNHSSLTYARRSYDSGKGQDADDGMLPPPPPDWVEALFFNAVDEQNATDSTGDSAAALSDPIHNDLSFNEDNVQDAYMADPTEVNSGGQGSSLDYMYQHMLGGDGFASSPPFTGGSPAAASQRVDPPPSSEAFLDAEITANSATQEELETHVSMDDEFAWQEQLEVINADYDGEAPTDDSNNDSEIANTFWWLQPPVDSSGKDAPLRVPDKEGRLPTSSNDVNRHGEQQSHDQQVGSSVHHDGDAPKQSISSSSALLATNSAAMVNRHSFLSKQDRLYLSTEPNPEVVIPLSSSIPQQKRSCVLAVFSANDLRVHDNYVLALTSVCARAHGKLPVVAAIVVDYRTFAQPSAIGGFFRQSPLRATFFLENVAALRRKLEAEFKIPLLVRCGRPEEHIPRLAVELGAVDVFMTTQYAPHERRVHDSIMRRVKAGCWISRRVLKEDDVVDPQDESTSAEGAIEEDLVMVVEHTTGHPYGASCSSNEKPAVPHSVWQTTLVHLDDLPTPVASMKEGERWYHDDVTTASIRATSAYDAQIALLRELPSWQELLPTDAELKANDSYDRVPAVRGRIPSLSDLGYSEAARMAQFEEVIATQSSHPTAGEDAAMERVADWLHEDGMSSMMRFGRDRRTNTKLYSQRLARVSPYISLGILSPRKFYEMMREHTYQQLRDGFVQTQYREALLRLSRRDYWHWMGLRYGDRLFFSYGPHPQETDDTLEWQHSEKIVQKWCAALTGIPFADAAMRELVGTGFVAHEGRQALAWLLTRGYGQDWRIGAEWLERCSLDYDPFVCYGNYAYCSGLIHDDFGEPVRDVHYLAHQHDQTGIYVKKWLPQLSKVPPVYIHRPHIMTKRMQAMHHVFLGKTYPYPMKLWDGAQHTLSSADLPAYFDRSSSSNKYREATGYAEAVRHGTAVMQPEELHAAVHPQYVAGRPWTAALPSTAFADDGEEEEVYAPRAKGSTPHSAEMRV